MSGNAALQSLLGHDMETTQGLRQTVEAQNADLTVNGIRVTSATNTVQEAMQGVTMTLLDTGSSTVKVERELYVTVHEDIQFMGRVRALTRFLFDLFERDKAYLNTL